MRRQWNRDRMSITRNKWALPTLFTNISPLQASIQDISEQNDDRNIQQQGEERNLRLATNVTCKLYLNLPSGSRSGLGRDLAASFHSLVRVFSSSLWSTAIWVQETKKIKRCVSNSTSAMYSLVLAAGGCQANIGKSKTSCECNTNLNR